MFWPNLAKFGPRPFELARIGTWDLLKKRKKLF